MNFTPYILLATGLILIFLEFFLPGGVLGIAGGVLVLLSVVVFAMQVTSGLYVFLYAAGCVLFVGLLILYTIQRIKKGKVKGIFLNTEQKGYYASAFDKSLVGKRGKALTDLRPAGHILVEGKRYQAVSITGYLEKGTPIEVVGGEGAHLRVKHIEEL